MTAAPCALLARALDDAALARELAEGGDRLAVLREHLARADETLAQAYYDGADPGALVATRAWAMDTLLGQAWQCWLAAAGEAALVAVGGYGRGELHPCSDVDVMVLLPEPAGETQSRRIEDFMAKLWDLGISPGHSVRTLADCVEQAEREITVVTSLMESRRIAGSEALFRAMRAAVAPERMWAGPAFFNAKCAEQQARHAKFHDTAYNLEPNIKESPGGLRDIQIVGWVAKRHYRCERLHDLVDAGFLTEDEHAALDAGQRYLWGIRYGLHLLAGRAEDRLLFDYQRDLARLYGYRDEHAQNLDVEQFMQAYYRRVMTLEGLTERLLQLYREDILHAGERAEPEPLNARFQVTHGYLEVRDEEILERQPTAMLELFLLLARHRGIQGVRASTIRLLRRHRHRLDEHVRADPQARATFMALLREPEGVSAQLARMNRYGILAQYLPVFGHIVGRMQYDLFHVYTVDQHTLFVIRNLERFGDPDYAGEFPLGQQIFSQVRKRELLYLAGLFHDIAKGRGGDHSELGAADAREFCRAHGLANADAAFVAWLVEHHLLMSVTAQRRDITDPEVINELARAVGDWVHLDYLYLLTVADICGTDPKLWNSWKDKLLAELYVATRYALRRGLENPIDREEWIGQTKDEALEQLRGRGVPLDRVEAIWADFPEECFLRYTADQITWQTLAISGATDPDQPLVLVRRASNWGSTEVFVYTRDRDGLFAAVTAVLDQLGLNVVDARVITSHSGMALDTFHVLDSDGQPVDSEHALQEIRAALPARLNAPSIEPTRVRRAVPRRLRHFMAPTRIDFEREPGGDRTQLEIVTTDRPGLLSGIGQAFVECGIRVHNAKVATFGDRVEDFFSITDGHDRPLEREEQFEALRAALVRHLDDPQGLGHEQSG